jgi:hypothetical protein
LSNPQKLKTWLETSGLDPNKIKKSSRLCSDHFEHSCFVRVYEGKKLKEGAFPTIFGDRSSTCVYCGLRRDRLNKRSLHKFPLRRKTIFQKWLNSFSKQGFVLTAKSALCSDHFEARCFNKPGCLKPNAVPTIFLATNDEGKILRFSV